MYQLTNYGGSGLQVVTPNPPDAGGAAINANFKALATQIATANPGVDDDATDGFGVGSRWYNSATTVEWICLDATPGGADWVAVASAALAGYLPLAGGTMSGNLTLGDGNTLYLDSNAYIQGFGDGYMRIMTITGLGRFLQLNDITIGYGGAIAGLQSLADAAYGTIYSANSFGNGSTQFSGTATSAGHIAGNATSNLNANALNMNTGAGSGGTTLNMDGGTMSNANSIGLQPTSAPSSPTTGQIYYDSTANHFYGWNGTAWKQLDN